MNYCDTILRYAKQRQRAYQITKTLTGRRAAAISKILRVAAYMKGKSAEWRAIRQTEQELIAILPDEQSRFQKQRESILSLINQCHE